MGGPEPELLFLNCSGLGLLAMTGASRLTDVYQEQTLGLLPAFETLQSKGSLVLPSQLQDMFAYSSAANMSNLTRRGILVQARQWKRLGKVLLLRSQTAMTTALEHVDKNLTASRLQP